MYFHGNSKVIFKSRTYKFEFMRKQIDIMKNKIGSSSIDGKRPVAIALERTPKLIAAIFAMLEMEVPFLLVDCSTPINRIKDMLDQAEVKHIIVENNNGVDFGQIERICYYNYDYYDESSIEYEKNLNRKYGNKSAYVLFTSGTTGKPKGVEITRSGLFNFIEGMSQVIDFSKGKTIISLSMHTFDIFFLETILALMRGMTVVLAAEDERKNPKKIKELVVFNDVDIIQMTPSAMQLIYLYDRELQFLKNVKEILIGGEVFPYRLLEILQKATNSRIFNMYGPTETTIWSMVADLTKENKIHLGKPIINTSIYLLDDSLHPITNGKIGEIFIGGAGLAKGYINDENLTNQSFVLLKTGERIYRTGDYGCYDESGKLICHGRKDSQVKVLGHRIELDDIDNNLMKFPEILDCVTCFDKSETNSLITFYKASKTIEKDNMISFLRDCIPEYMIPYEYIRVFEFIYNTNGKLSRKDMLKKFYHLSEVNVMKKDKSALTVKMNIFEKAVCILCKYINSNVELSDKTRLEDLPIDSLKYIQIIVDLENEFKIDFDIECLSKSYFESIGDIVKYISVESEKRNGE